MHRLVSTLLFLVGPPLASAAAASLHFNVCDYGAIGDGVTKDTAAIARAVDACSVAGGGTVEFPAGKYLTGTIRLRSNMALMVGAGATILGSPDVADYPITENPWGKDDWKGPRQMSPLIYADSADHVTIIGPGTIDGQGEIWWKRLWFTMKKRTAIQNIDGVVPADAEYVKHNGDRPRLIRLVNCQHVRVEDITLLNSPRWTLCPLFCDHVNITGVTIVNPPYSPNTDGINPESCRDVHISNCFIDVGDDGITLKSGRDAVGRQRGRPTEDVTITNCTVHHAHGGIVIGSEMSGDVRNVTVSNCVFNGTVKGVRIKSNRNRGGIVERVRINNLVMQNVGEAINIVTFYFSSDTPDQVFPVSEGTPRFRDIRISGVTASGSTLAGQITGLKEMPISDIELTDIHIEAKTGFKLQNARGIRFNGVQIDTHSGPSIKASDANDIEIEGFRNATPHKEAALVEMKNVRNLWIRDARAPDGTETFLSLAGAASAGITLKDNDLTHASEEVRFTDGADKRILSDR